MTARFDVSRTIPAPASGIVAVRRDLRGLLAAAFGTVCFPVVVESALRAALGVLERTVVTGFEGGPVSQGAVGCGLSLTNATVPA
ncbi:MAG: hypothetical protein ACT4QF_03270 [Sporichthyaceae bacterium]